MAFILGVFQTGDYDAWKQMFDSDPAGRADSGGTGHRVFRSLDDPSEVFVSVQFDSDDDATAFRDKLLGSGALDNVTQVKAPTVAELVDEKRY